MTLTIHIWQSAQTNHYSETKNMFSRVQDNVIILQGTTGTQEQCIHLQVAWWCVYLADFGRCELQVNIPRNGDQTKGSKPKALGKWCFIALFWKAYEFISGMSTVRKKTGCCPQIVPWLHFQQIPGSNVNIAWWTQWTNCGYNLEFTEAPEKWQILWFWQRDVLMKSLSGFSWGWLTLQRFHDIQLFI